MLCSLKTKRKIYNERNRAPFTFTYIHILQGIQKKRKLDISIYF